MPLKILYLRTVYWFNLKAGGSVGHTSGVINALYKVTNLTVVTNDRLYGVNKKTKIIPPIRVKVFPNEYNELLYNFRLRKHLPSYIKETDIIYQRYSGFSFMGCYLAKKMCKKFILEFNSSDVWKITNWSAERNPIKRILKKMVKLIFFYSIVSLVERYNLKNATKIIVVSDVLKNRLVNRNIPSNKIVVNPNGVDVTKYNTTISGKEIRNILGISENSVVYGFIGSFGQWHGVLEMAKAIVLFLENNHDKKVHFILIGNGNLFNQTKEIISNSKYSSRVTFTGQIPQDKGPKYLAACDILLSPHIQNPDGTAFFGSPTKLFEYMAMGKAIIASNLFQIGEILEHKKTAILTEPGNINQLAKAMEQLVADKMQINFLGKNAREEVIQKYTWDVHVQNILNKIERK